MKQKFYSLLLLLAVTLAAHAQEKQWCLVVESASGETIAIGANVKPQIATTASGYELKYGEEVTAFTWSELKKVTLEEAVPSVSTAIKEVPMADPAVPSFHAAPGEIVINGAETGSVARIFSLNGRQAQSARVGEDGSVSLSTQGLPAGIYIVKTNKSSFKIIKK